MVGTGEIREVPIQALYRAVGYFGSPLPGVPFDKRHGVIPNREGQVLRKDSNERVPGVYATGWIKRGPVGPHRPHQVRRDGDRPPHHQRPGVVVAAGRPVRGGDPGAARRARRALDRPRGLAPPRRARGRRSALRTAARASRSCRGTRWSTSRAESEPRSAQSAEARAPTTTRDTSSMRGCRSSPFSTTPLCHVSSRPSGVSCSTERLLSNQGPLIVVHSNGGSGTFAERATTAPTGSSEAVRHHHREPAHHDGQRIAHR